MVTKDILMDGDKSVCAFFKKKKYTLTIIASNGTATGAGVYDAKTVVNVQATPNAGYQFDNWSGGLTGSVNPTTIIMTSNKTVTANFSLIPVVKYTLTTSVDPIDGGTITGAGTYNVGVTVTVEATPAVDYDFDHWSGETTIPIGAILPQDYATGDGTAGNPWANDCIKKAYDACPDNGTIYLKAGYYNLPTSFGVTKQVNIIGENRTNTFIILGMTTTKGIIVAKDYCTLKGFTVDGASQVDSTAGIAVIEAYNCDYISMEDIEVKNGGYYGLNIYEVNHSTFQNIYASANWWEGIHPGADHVGRNKFNIYRNIYCWDGKRCGFADRGISTGNEEANNVYENIQAWNNAWYGISIAFLNNGVLTNSSSINNGREGLLVYYANNINNENVIIKNNNASNSPSVNGIKVEGSNVIKFINCQSFDDRTTPLQCFGLGVYTSTEVNLSNCILVPNKLGDIYNPNGTVITIINN